MDLNADPELDARSTAVSASSYALGSDEERESLLAALQNDKRDTTSQLAEFSRSLQHSQQKCMQLADQLEQLHRALHVVRTEKAKVDHQHQFTCAREHHYKSLSQQLLVKNNEIKAEIASLRQRVATTEELLQQEREAGARLALENEELQTEKRERLNGTVHGEGTNTPRQWKQRLSFCFKYFLFVCLVQVFTYIVLLYTIGWLDLEVVVRGKTAPAF